MIDLPEMITLRESARRTGISYDCLRKKCLSGEIIHVWSGNKILINADKLREYLEAGDGGKKYGN